MLERGEELSPKLPVRSVWCCIKELAVNLHLLRLIAKTVKGEKSLFTYFNLISLISLNFNPQNKNPTMYFLLIKEEITKTRKNRGEKKDSNIVLSPSPTQH